jgi:hypothetical protein
MNLERAYRALLRLYPKDYQALFAAEMLISFGQAAGERRRQAGLAFIRFLLGELMGLLCGAGAEWVAKLTGNRPAGGRSLTDFPTMRPRAVLEFAETGVNASQTGLPREVMEAQERIAILVRHMVHAIANHDFSNARRYSYEERQARHELRRLREKHGIDDSENYACS